MKLFLNKILSICRRTSYGLIFVLLVAFMAIEAFADTKSREDGAVTSYQNLQTQITTDILTLEILTRTPILTNSTTEITLDSTVQKSEKEQAKENKAVEKRIKKAAEEEEKRVEAIEKAEKKAEKEAEKAAKATNKSTKK